MEIIDYKRVKKELYWDVLELIFKRLNFLDLTNSKLVCSTWNSVSKHVSLNQHVPCLVLPPIVDGNNFSLFDVEDKTSFNLKIDMASFYEVGSSHGCLILLDQNLIPYVLNPLTASKVKLPQFIHRDSNSIVMRRDIIDKDLIHMEIPPREPIEDKTQHWYLRTYLIRKVILSSNPFSGSKKFSVAVIYGMDLELAYLNAGDPAWTRLDQDKNGYTDIMFHENKLYAVEGRTTHVEVWDFSGSFPKKLMKLEPSRPEGLWEDYCAYLVQLSGRILLVARKVADYVDENGNEVMAYYRYDGEEEEEEEEEEENEDEEEDEEENGNEVMAYYRYDGEEEEKEENEGEDGNEVMAYYSYDGEEEEKDEEDNDEEIDPDMNMAVGNEDDHESENVKPLPLVYRTLSFCVYKMDMLEQQWEEVSSLEGCAIFLGGNHTISISTHQLESMRCEDNSIYFTDDSWSKMCRDSFCGGHDRGVFNMRDKKVKMFDDYGSNRMQPSPCWITPIGL